MTPEKIQHLLAQVAAGQVSVKDGMEQLSRLPFSELPHSTLDTHRELRQGIPETVFGENKTPEQLADILGRLGKSHGRALATRVSPEAAAFVLDRIPSASYSPVSRLLSLGESPSPRTEAPYAAVACAGTSDLPVAEEAAQTLAFLGQRVERLTDVGVAGVHRLLDKIDVLRDASIVLCVAGMEGALTSVIGGLVAAPVIGIPTSVGYGVAQGGHAALNAMLSSCASGVAVVNIDNGFGAAVFAHSILSKLQSPT